MSSGPWKQADHPLARWRVAHGLTQDDIAAKAGVSQATISKIERNEAVKLWRLRAVLALKPGEFTAEYYVNNAQNR